MQFVLKGDRYSLTREQVEKRLRGVRPRVIYGKYYVIVNRRRYPCNQALSVALEDRPCTQTVESVPVLKRLGFEIYRLSE